MSPAPTDDPFAEIHTGRTFVVPTPGARGAAPTVRAAAGGSAADVAADIGPSQSGLNPLVALANRLLALVPQIRATTHLPDPVGLRESIAQGLREFESQARARSIAPERVLAARYILCTLIDEVAAGMPWGSAGQWGRHSLLAMFHNETGGGEKVFQLMAKLAKAPAANRDLLELIYAALCLGFEGRYRVAEGGRAQIESVRERLAQILRKERGDYAGALAQHWKGEAPRRRALLGWLPLWVTAVVAGLALVSFYLLLSFRLSAASDPLFAQIQQPRLLPAAQQQAARAPARAPRLEPLLQGDIKSGLIAVRDDIDRSVVVVRGDGLFAPASASLSAERAALMKRIAEALAKLPNGALLVAGHTDNQPIRSARFPSNWHLSEARARTVRDMLVADGVAAGRIKAEGRAETQPLVANDSAANRALNRRVEITLMVPAGPAAAPPRAKP